MNISVVIIVYNEEKNIEACLESVQTADEILVVDGFSQDRTVEIAKRYKAVVYQNPWPGYAEQKNFGLSKASKDWVLFLDADERLSPELLQAISRVISDPGNKHKGYYLRRHSFYLGRWVKHGEWQSDYPLRLVKKEHARWSNLRVHEKIDISDGLEHLNAPLYHYPYQNIRHHLTKFKKYSSLFAEDAFARREAATLKKVFWDPLKRFVKGYFFKQGFKDGFAGFIIAFFQSVEVFWRYTKLRKLNWQMGISKGK